MVRMVTVTTPSNAEAEVVDLVSALIRFDTGGPLGWGTALLRNLCRIVSGIPCFLGYFWMLWDREKQTWHDKLSNTVVVPVTDYPPPPNSFGQPPAAA